VKSDDRHLDRQALEAGLDEIRRSPRDRGTLCMIVRRPQVDARETLEQGELDLAEGLVGDGWAQRGSRKTPDGAAHADMQLNVMNARTIALIAREESRWPLAGDQLFVDLDLSEQNLPPGTRLAIGSASIEVTSEPHAGCQKFVKRYGTEAMRFVNSPLGRQLRLRGLNARVVEPGVIRVGDVVRKLPPAS
jgi:MOSC domain-containing protein YiiM